MPCILGSKPPVDSGALLISSVLPCLNLALEGLLVGDTPTKTLPPEDGKLNLRHIQPTPVLRGIVKLKFFSDPPGFLCIKGFIQGSRLMCIEVIANQQNLFCVWEMHIHYISADMCEINASALVSDFNVSKAVVGCENHEQIADAIAFIFRIISIRFAHITGAAGAFPEERCLLVSSTHTTGRLGSSGRA